VSRRRSHRQRKLRRRRDERAFLFDPSLSKCFGSVEREDWEDAVRMFGGDITAAAEMCGLTPVPRGTKALWGRSAEEALATYRRWKKKKRS